MKTHITNIYNGNSQMTYVKKQRRYAEVGLSLGYYEMGIFVYQVNTDTEGELSKRLDGIIASLESSDTVVVQLPTGNGYQYESHLLAKIKAYKDTKVIILLHEADSTELPSYYIEFCRTADGVIADTSEVSQELKRHGIYKIVEMNHLAVLEDSAINIKSSLLTAVEKYGSSEKKSNKIEEEVHIAFGLHDKNGNYSVWVGTAMQSVIEHTRAKICFHILHDSTLNEDNRKKLCQVAERVGDRVLFHYFDEKCFDSICDKVGRFTIGTMFRIMLPEILPELSKIIYLDADLLVARDVEELWKMNIKNCCMMAAPDAGVTKGNAISTVVSSGEVSADRYFNAGILYMNLDRIRQKGNLRLQVIEYVNEKENLLFPDQDALNALYTDDVIFLDDSWNYFVICMSLQQKMKVENKIYHYAGAILDMSSLSEIDFLYYQTIQRTLWGEEECRRQERHLFERVVDQSQLRLQITPLLAEISRKRIYYGDETMAMKNLYQLFHIRDIDYRVLEHPRKEQGGILPCQPLSILREEKKPYIVFVLPQADEGRAMANLEKMGLQNGRDYFVIPRILSAMQGGYV